MDASSRYLIRGEAILILVWFFNGEDKSQGVA